MRRLYVAEVVLAVLVCLALVVGLYVAQAGGAGGARRVGRGRAGVAGEGSVSALAAEVAGTVRISLAGMAQSQG